MTTGPNAPEDGFFSRWARRKAQVREGGAVAPERSRAAPVAPIETPPPIATASISGALGGPIAGPVAAPGVGPTAQPRPATDSPAVEAPPTLADVALLTRDSDYARFVGAGVDSGVTQAAMKKLFSDPHFNVMDGLDTYIDDYGKPDPIPLSMLKQMNQSKFLRLFDDDEDAAPKTAEQIAETSAEPAAEPSAEPPAQKPNPPDDHADLRLQQDPAARQPGLDQGARA